MLTAPNCATPPQELTRDLFVKHPVPPAAAKPAPRTPRKGASSSSGGAASTAAAEAGNTSKSSRPDADAANTPDQRAGGLPAAIGAAGGAAPASVRSRAVALAHALDVIGAVRVSSDRLVLPAEYLRAALQQCLLLQLNEMVVLAEVSRHAHGSSAMRRSREACNVCAQYCLPCSKLYTVKELCNLFRRQRLAAFACRQGTPRFLLVVVIKGCTSQAEYVG